MINRYSSEPLYCQLKSIILKKIENGEYKEDEKIPSELELCQEYNISRPTVRQAITELTNSGQLYKIKGKGTFVSRNKKRIDIKDYSGFTPSILDYQSTDDRIIISTRVINDTCFDKLRSVFNIPLSHYNKVEFAEIIYQTKYGNEIYSINVSYIPLNLFPDIIDNVLSSQASHEILKGKYPLVPEKSKSMLEVIHSSQEDSKYLEIQVGQPLIKIENIIYSKSGQIVEFVITKYRADKCRLIFGSKK